MSDKYPRTFHLPFSPGSTSDDKFITEQMFDEFVGHELVYTEKLDGSNVCLTRDQVYSRSHAGPPGHVSFERLKRFHATINSKIWEGLSIFGEWCYAVHSIEYSMLQHHLNIFGVREDQTGEWWPWADVTDFATSLNVPTVPVLLHGAVKSKTEIQEIVEGLAALSSVYGPVREGIVVRRADSFTEFETSVVKWVRANHIQTDEHWTRKQVQRQPAMILV